MNSRTLKALQDCLTMCEQSFSVLLGKPDVHARHLQLLLLLDCIDICESCIKFMTRQSYYTKSLCRVCAFICEACGNECLKFPDKESKMCGHMALTCAKECRALYREHNFTLKTKIMIILVLYLLPVCFLFICIIQLFKSVWRLGQY